VKTAILVFLLAAAADKPLLDAARHNSFPDGITRFGGHDALLISALMFGTGWVARDDRLRAAGLESAEAQEIASQLIVPVLKRAAGRARPLTNEGTYHFEPFSGGDSFPSSHATTAFAAATAIAANYDNRIVPVVVYSIATGVAIARVHDNAHFPSDVVAGAILGRVVARVVVRHHGWIVLPRRGGVMVVYRSAAR